MNITQIKSQIGADQGISVPVLQFVTQLTEDKQPTEWVSHWDNTNRIRVSMHQDVLGQIVKDTTFNGLALKTETVTPVGKEPYVRYIVITPLNIVATF